MIDSSTAATTAASATAPAKSPASAKPSGLASDFETFLKMLTAQARYQDPLEPIDSTEYAAQLAQFSMVEQQVKTNDTLTLLSGQMDQSSMASLAGWVGMEARAETPIAFDGSPITVSPNPARTADQAFLVVTDTAGKEVQRQQIPTQADPIQWAGVDGNGQPFANGTYSFSVESLSGGKAIKSGPTEVYGRIAEAQVQNNGVMLIFEGGHAVPATSVTALREGG